MIFYDYNGEPVAYSEDDIHIYLFTGEPVAYFDKDAVYGYNGKQLGWFNNGWIRDLNGCCVFFTENSTGSGPVKPVKHVCPEKSIKHVKPVKCMKAVQNIRPVSCLDWSPLTGTAFFTQ